MLPEKYVLLRKVCLINRWLEISILSNKLILIESLREGNIS